MLKKIRTTELPISRCRQNRKGDIRGTESEDTVCLGDLGLGLQVPEDGVLAELVVSFLLSW
jgi:hypothetical protein